MLVLQNRFRSFVSRSIEITTLLNYAKSNGSACKLQPPTNLPLRNLPGNSFNQLTQQQRHIWGYVAVAFNKVDRDRLARVGPDRLCAEWVLKNGGAIGFVGMGGKVLRDYNALPPENSKVRIQVVDASEASVMKIGLEHFNGCNSIETVIFHNCKHLEVDGLAGLGYLKNTLKKLQISGCYNLYDESFDVLTNLQNLQHLILFDLTYVKDLKTVAQKLQQSLPNCKIETA